MREDFKVHKDFSDTIILNHASGTGCVLYRYSVYKRSWRTNDTM